MKNLIFTVIAIFGFAIILLGAALAFEISIVYLRLPEAYWSHTGDGGPKEGIIGLAVLGAFGLGFIGLLFAHIGRAVSKQYYFWIVFIILGSLYCLSFFGIVYSNYKYAQHSLPGNLVKPLLDFVGSFILLFPGLFLIFSGLLLRFKR